MHEPDRSCLVFGPNQRAVPLRGVRIDARLQALCSEVTVTQRYHNTESVPVECVYVFPLEESAAVSGFRARIGKRVVEGRVEERDKAFETYDDAMAEGHGAFLLDQERPNVFTASVGNLEPGQEVEVSITYVALLTREGDAVRFQIPTTVSPRYVPPSDMPEVGEPDGERVNPDRWLAVPYGLTLNVELDMDSNIKVIESPSHTLRTELDGHRARASLSARDTALDRDFVLLVETRSANEPRARLAKEQDGTRVAMVTFTPASEDLPASGGSEIVFLLDCSGSMMGDSMAEARRALALCVRAMSEDDTFNIIRFGSRFTSLWDEPRRYDDKSLEEATRYIQGADANLGGTEILAPLQHIVGHRVDAERPRQVLLLTDGQVSNEDAVIALCREHAATTRVFTFGIGAGASEHLVRGVARASRGAAEFIYPGERIEPKVLRMFGRLGTPALTDVRVDWGGLSVEQAPARVPPVFGGDSLTVFARVTSGHDTSVTLRAKERSWSVPLNLEKAYQDPLVPTLWARAMIRDLEADAGAPRGSSQGRRRSGERVDKKRARLIELGVRYGLMSSATSYVAVEERSADERTTSQAELRRIPVALTSGWGGRGSARPGISAVAFSMPVGAAGMARPAPMPAMASPSMAAAPAGAPPPRARMSKREVLSNRPNAAMASRFEGAAPPPPAPRRPAAPSPAPAGGSASTGQGQADGEQGSDRLFDLLLTQRADGSFPMSPALRQWLGARAAEVDAAAAEHGEALVVTEVVLVLLERRAAHRSAEWTPAARKARRWLDKNGQRFDASALV